MSREFENRRAVWLLEAQRRHDSECRQLGSVVEVQVRTYTPRPRPFVPAASPTRRNRAHQEPAAGLAPVAAVGPGGAPSLPLVRDLLSQKDQRAFVLVPLDMGRAVFVPSGAMFFGGDRAWRCEVST